jgi:hypothetical protein
MAYQKVFCSVAEFNEVFLSDGSNVILEKIIEDFCDVYLDISEDELAVLKYENPILKSFSKRDNANVLSGLNDFGNIKANNFIPFLNDILLLNKDYNTEAIRNDYGIFAVKSTDKEYLDSLDYHFGYSLNDNPKNTINCWNDIFQGIIPPTNSAILIDNFLWGKLENFNDDNLENLYIIFQNIIPQSLKIPFHLSIIISNKDARLSPHSAQEKINKVAKNLKRITGKNIEISITTQTDTKTFHERVILTSHQYIYSHKGFTIFKDNKLVDQTNGDRNWVYKDVRKYQGEIRKHQHYELSRNILKQINSNNRAPTNVTFNLGNTNNPILN